jgi:inosine-uridine nucleoside N-ribohydrolase
MQIYGKENLVGVSTTFYKPDQKARIARLILNEYGWNSVPVYAGIGIYDAGIQIVFEFH